MVTEKKDDSVAQIVGSSITVPLGDGEYSLAPIKVSDWGAFEQYIRSERIRMFMQTAAKEMDAAERRVIINDLLTQPMPWVDVRREFEQTHGALFILWCSLKRGGHTEMTLEEAGGLFEFMDLPDLFIYVNKVTARPGTATAEDDDEGDSENPPQGQQEQN